jgi:hypothetical protein
VTSRLLRLVLASALAVPAVGVVSHRATLAVDCSAAAVTVPHHVALVVEHKNGALVRVCVGFSGPTISAEDALRASGLELGVNSSGGYGDEVCQIDNEPASYPPECLQQGQPFWSLWVSRADGGWTLSPVGVSSLTLADGDAEGWHFDNGGGAAPPSPHGTCPVPAPAAAPPPTRTPPPVTHPATVTAPNQQAVPSAATTAAAPTTGVPPASVPPTAPLVALAPSVAPSPSTDAGVTLRSGPAVTRPSGGGPSVAGWTLYGLLFTAGLAVLAAQIWRRRRTT